MELIKDKVKAKEALEKARQEEIEKQNVDLDDFYSELQKFKEYDHLKGWEGFNLKDKYYHVVQFKYLPKVVREASLITDSIEIRSFVSNPEDFDQYEYTHVFKVVAVSPDLENPRYKEGELVTMSHALTAGKDPTQEYTMFMNNNNGFNKTPVLSGPKYMPKALKNLQSRVLALPHEFNKKGWDMSRFSVLQHEIVGSYDL